MKSQLLLTGSLVLAPSLAVGELTRVQDRGEGRIEAVATVADDLMVIRSAGHDAAPPPGPSPRVLGLPTWTGPGPLASQLPPNTRVFVSENGRIQAIARYEPGEGGQIETTVDLYSQGRVVWSRSVAGTPSYLVSDDGSTVAEVFRDIHQPQSNRVGVLDGESGEVIALLERPLLREVVIASGGETIVLSTGHGQIQAVDRTGKQLYQLESTAEFALGANGRLIATLEHGRVEVFSNGDRVASYPVEDFARAVAFGQRTDLLAIADDSALQIHRVGDPTRSRTVSLGEGVKPQSVVVLENGSPRFLVGTLEIKGQERWSTKGEAEAAVLLMAADGEMLQRDDIDIDTWNSETPEIRLLEGVDRPLVQMIDELYEFTIRADGEGGTR